MSINDSNWSNDPFSFDSTGQEEIQIYEEDLDYNQEPDEFDHIYDEYANTAKNSKDIKRGEDINPGRSFFVELDDEWGDDAFDNLANIHANSNLDILPQNPAFANIQKSKEEELSSINKIIENLNPEQQIAATTTEGPVIVIAGAGTGKTNTLIHRVAVLMSKGVQPGNILIMTFTNKAASEIKERLSSMIGDMGDYVTAGTFHSIILRSFIKKNTNSKYLESIGYDLSLLPDLKMSDENDTLKIFKESLSELPIEHKDTIEESEWKASEFISFMTLLRAEGHDYKSFRKTISISDKDFVFKQILSEAWEIYTHKCRELNIIDFDDVLVIANNMLKAEPEYCEQLAKIYQYIHLDEYQDTNQVQMEIMDQIAKHHENIFTVGDEKQSIYAFRGSKYAVIMSFIERYSNAKLIELNRNYRSGESIIDLSNYIATNMPKKLSDGQLIAMSEFNSLQPKIVSFTNEYEEAQVVTKAIKKYISTGTNPNDIAILVRNKFKKDVIEKILVSEGIEYNLVGDRSFYKRSEVRDAIAMISFLSRPNNDSLSGQRLIKSMRIGISDKEALKWITTNTIGGSTVYDFFKNAAVQKKSIKKKEDTDYPLKESAKKANVLVKLIENIYLGIKEGETPSVINEKLSTFWDIFLRPQVVKEKKDGSSDYSKNQKVENVKFIIDLFTKGLENGKRPDQIIDELDLMIENQDEFNDTPKVQIMTIHASKGLEFPKVFMIGSYDIFDDISEEDKDEERRLMYVGVTRAKEQLNITYPLESMIYGKKMRNKQSFFIDELTERQGLQISHFKAKNTPSNNYSSNNKYDFKR